MPTNAEEAQEVLRRARMRKAAGEHVWTPEQLADITARAQHESLDSIAMQYHCTVEDVARGLREAVGQQ